MEKKLRVCVIENDAELRDSLTKALNDAHVTLNHQNEEFTLTVDEFTADEFQNKLNNLNNSIAKKPGQCSSFLALNDTNSDDNLMSQNMLPILAHELKAPLVAIENYLQIISDKSLGDDPETYEQMQKRCIVRAKQMRSLIGDLLKLNAIYSGQMQRELTNVDLVEIAASAITGMTQMADKNNIKLTLEYDETKPTEILADPSEMQIILNNLLSNAIKYNKPDGYVKIEIKKSNSETIISVNDNGIGIAEEDFDNIFRKFSRIKNDKTSNIDGTGLGLCLVKKIIELYHGKINVKSNNDSGTTFMIRLPD
jgi:two-component system, sensor histidine kinase and response regulator